MPNKKLTRAFREKMDEFYTTMGDIEKEMQHYRQQFKGKVIYCNCDDYRQSNFVKYFKKNFHTFGLKKLIATHYTTESAPLFEKPEYPMGIEITSGGERHYRLRGSGCFSSRECAPLLQEADIVITNPPFSKIRWYLHHLMHHNKKFLVMAPLTAVAKVQITEYIKKGAVRVGYNVGAKWFHIQKEFIYPKAKTKVVEGKTAAELPGVVWLTTLPVKHKHLQLTKSYTSKEYPKYDNYDAINVNKVADIPKDYSGKMGVPINFLQYGILEFSVISYHGQDMRQPWNDLIVDGKKIFSRVIIQRKQHSTRLKTFIDLFCGIGGFRVALERKGLRCVFSSEIDIHAMGMYKKNFGELPKGDITEIPAEDIPAHDVLCAGFPCQSFSVAGNKEGFLDTRGELFHEIVRIARHHRPPVLLLENVPGILSLFDGAVMRAVCHELRSIGYKTQYSVLNASLYGFPQTRKRVYFVCLHRDAPYRYREPEKTLEKVYLSDVLEDEDAVEKRVWVQRDDITLIKRAQTPLLSAQLAAQTLAPRIIGQFGEGKMRQGYAIYSPDGHAITQLANSGSRMGKTGAYLVNGRVRCLTVMEGKRVMSFPDTHEVSKGGKGHQQLGNAVMPGMVEKVFDGISRTDAWPRSHLRRAAVCLTVP